MASYRAAAACKIVGYDVHKLNTAIARGTYVSPPQTTKGSARLFNEVELLRLFFYARFRDEGTDERRAGEYSYDIVHSLLKNNPEAKKITIVYSALSDWGWRDPRQPEMPDYSNKPYIASGAPEGFVMKHEARHGFPDDDDRLYSWRIFDVEAVREHLAERKEKLLREEGLDVVLTASE